jgi:hypothetical protein
MKKESTGVFNPLEPPLISQADEARFAKEHLTKACNNDTFDSVKLIAPRTSAWAAEEDYWNAPVVKAEEFKARHDSFTAE